MGGLMKVLQGLWNDNPTFRLQIGLCPVLAVTSSALNGLGMGCDNLCIDLLECVD